MRSKKIVSTKECSILNTLRAEHQNRNLSRTEVIDMIRDSIGWKREDVITSMLGKVFVRIQRGVYKFPEHPIYIGKLQGIFDSLSRKGKQPVIQETVTVIVDPIEEAIKLLKNDGYKITKQFLDVEKALQEPARPVSDFIIIEEY